jgi:hypothetical protein
MTEPKDRADVVADLTKRLRPVCLQWPEELFTAMVEHLADITVKYDERLGTSSYDRRTTDRLISDLREALQRSETARGGAEDADTTR